MCSAYMISVIYVSIFGYQVSFAIIIRYDPFLSYLTDLRLLDNYIASMSFVTV